MVKEITDLSLRVVLEHMEPNKRIYFISRCPSLVQIEKFTPLRIRKLKIHENAILVNDFSYEIGTEESYWRTLLGYGTELKLEISNGTRIIKNSIPSNFSSVEALKTLFDYISGARTQISVGNLNIFRANSKIKIKNVVNLEFIGRDPDSWLENLTQPLKSLKIKIGASNNLLQYSKYTQDLKISDFGSDNWSFNYTYTKSRTLHVLLDRDLENVTMENLVLPNEDLMSVARNWIRYKARIGMNLAMALGNKRAYIHDPLMEEIRRLNGISGFLKDKHESFIKDIGLCCCFRIDDSSELVIYHVQNRTTRLWYSKMEVIPTGRFIRFQDLTFSDFFRMYYLDGIEEIWEIFWTGTSFERAQGFFTAFRRARGMAHRFVINAVYHYVHE